MPDRPMATRATVRGLCALAAAVAMSGCATTLAARSSALPLERAIPTTTTVETTSAPPPAPIVTVAPGTAAPTARPNVLAALTIPLVDTSRSTVANGQLVSTSRRLTTLVWHPAGGGRRPLVVFAHGFRVGPTPYEHLCRAWAAAGYVVAAPEFPLTDAAVAGPNLDENDLANQPADVRFIVASLLAPSSPVAGSIDPERVAVAGHSDGAVTALAMADDAAVRPRAVIVLSGGPIGRALAHNPPILVAHGDQDTVDPPDQGQAVSRPGVSAPRFLLHRLGGAISPLPAEDTRWQTVDRVTVD